MFKIIGRILVILLVAALVAGGLYILVQHGSTNSTVFASDRQFQSSNTNGTFTPREQFGERDGESRFSLGRGLGGMLVTALEVGVITILVLMAQGALAKPVNPPGARN